MGIQLFEACLKESGIASPLLDGFLEKRKNAELEAFNPLRALTGKDPEAVRTTRKKIEAEVLQEPLTPLEGDDVQLLLKMGYTNISWLRAIETEYLRLYCQMEYGYEGIAEMGRENPELKSSTMLLFNVEPRDIPESVNWGELAKSIEEKQEKVPVNFLERLSLLENPLRFPKGPSVELGHLAQLSKDLGQIDAQNLPSLRGEMRRLAALCQRVRVKWVELHWPKYGDFEILSSLTEYLQEFDVKITDGFSLERSIVPILQRKMEQFMKKQGEIERWKQRVFQLMESYQNLVPSPYLKLTVKVLGRSEAFTEDYDRYLTVVQECMDSLQNFTGLEKEQERMQSEMAGLLQAFENKKNGVVPGATKPPETWWEMAYKMGDYVWSFWPAR